jgi:hypothetical protein
LVRCSSRGSRARRSAPCHPRQFPHARATRGTSVLRSGQRLVRRPVLIRHRRPHRRPHSPLRRPLRRVLVRQRLVLTSASTVQSKTGAGGGRMSRPQKAAARELSRLSGTCSSAEPHGTCCIRQASSRVPSVARFPCPPSHPPAHLCMAPLAHARTHACTRTHACMLTRACVCRRLRRSATHRLPPTSRAPHTSSTPSCRRTRARRLVRSCAVCVTSTRGLRVCAPLLTHTRARRQQSTEA